MLEWPNAYQPAWIYRKAREMARAPEDMTNKEGLHNLGLLSIQTWRLSAEVQLWETEKDIKYDLLQKEREQSVLYVYVNWARKNRFYL